MGAAPPRRGSTPAPRPKPVEYSYIYLMRKILKPSPIAPLPGGEGKSTLAGAAPLRPIASRFWSILRNMSY
jgi:hypothetical protein